MSESNVLTIDGSRVDVGELDELLAKVSDLGGAAFEIRTQVLVSSSDPMALYALEKLLHLDKPLEHVAVEPVEPEPVSGSKNWTSEPEPFKKKKAFRLNPAPERELAAWRVLDEKGNEIERLTIEEKNKRLAAKAFAPGTILHHPRVGRHKVSEAGTGMEPVE